MSDQPVRPLNIACIGECMGELLSEGEDYQLGFAGDTFNTATYLSRLLSPRGHTVAFVTVIGADPISAKMRNRFEAEGLHTDLVFNTPGRTVGLYLIDNDEKGERHFTYWRDSSAARTLMDADREDVLRDRFTDFDLIYLSGISLAILPDDARARLIQLLADLGRLIAFDPNYRAALWPSADMCQRICAKIAPHCRYILSGLEDEQSIWSHDSASAAAHAWRQRGAKEVVIKCGPDAAHILSDQGTEEIIPTPIPHPVDTTSAGDAFNAAYLAARLTGEEIRSACQAGHALSAKVIMHRGAIL